MSQSTFRDQDILGSSQATWQPGVEVTLALSREGGREVPLLWASALHSAMILLPVTLALDPRMRPGMGPST